MSHVTSMPNLHHAVRRGKRSVRTINWLSSSVDRTSTVCQLSTDIVDSLLHLASSFVGRRVLLNISKVQISGQSSKGKYVPNLLMLKVTNFVTTQCRMDRMPKSVRFVYPFR